VSRAGGEARRRRKARARKAEAVASAPVVVLPPRWPEIEAALVDCPDPANHKVCPKADDGHDWYKPNPRPEDHKYECAACGHYDLDDYR
jgi:hypothetical protein